MEMNLSKLWETVKDRGAWHAAIHGVAKSQHDSALKWTIACLRIQPYLESLKMFLKLKFFCFSDLTFMQLGLNIGCDMR